jgi:spore germination protein YaaH
MTLLSASLLAQLKIGAGLIIWSAQAASAATPAAPPPPTRHTLVYYEDDGGASSASLHARYADFDQLASDTYSVNGLGAVFGRTFTTDLAFARTKNIATFATVSNYTTDFIPAIAHSIITSTKHTQSVITASLGKLKLGHYRGLNVDFEGVPASDRSVFTAFIKTVSLKMHAAGYLVVVSVPAKSVDDPTDSWTGAFDFAALGQLIDVMQLMTYDEYGTWSDPGPVAGLDWVTGAIRYTVSVVPSSKVSLGLPAYGYDWDLTDPAANTQIAWTLIPPLLARTGATPQWDASSSSPYFTYTAKGHDHVVWYENAASLGEKTALVGAENLAGISVYSLGMEDASFWQAVDVGL